MGVSDDRITQLAKNIVDEKKDVSGKTVTGTAVKYNGSMYVRIDGSDQLTPIISSTVSMKEGDRVTVLIKDHKTTVTGNTTAPSVSQGDIDNSNQNVVDQITELEIVVAEKATIKDLEVEKARINDLVADNVVIKDGLTASKADIEQLKAKDVEISGNLTAQNAAIENLKVKKLDADIADIKFAKIENLEATNADIHNLKSDYGSFKQLTTDKFTANEASIKKLETEKLSAKDADLKYANIDFANIGKAAIENFFSKSGMIGDLIVGEGTVTGTLVGVTIKGDLIEGGTVKADKLVIKGNDGLYYKLNTDGEKVGAQQTEYNSLNGSIITAKSVTAEKVNVKDLVAFGATIGGFHITDSALYSGVKESVDNTTRGTYMDDTGQFSVGDASNYLKFFKDTDGKYKLVISASSMKLSSSDTTVEDALNGLQNGVDKGKVLDTKSGYLISIGENAGKKPISIVAHGETKQNLWVNPVGTNKGVVITENTDGSMTVNGKIPADSLWQETKVSYNLVPGKTYVLQADAKPKNAEAGFFIRGEVGQSRKTLASLGMTSLYTKQIFTFPTDAKGWTCGFQAAVTDHTNAGSDISGTYHVMLREATPEEIARASHQLSTMQEGGTADIVEDRPTYLPADPEIYAEQKVFDWVRPGINGVNTTRLTICGRNLLGYKNSGSYAGVTWTKNPDSSYTLNGTATELVELVLLGGYSNSVDNLRGTFRLSGGASNAKIYAMSYRSDRSYTGVGDSGNGVILESPNGDQGIGAWVSITKGTTLKDTVVRPMLSVGPDPVPYEAPIGIETQINLKGQVLHRLPDGTHDELHIDSSGAMKIVQHTQPFRVNSADGWTYDSKYKRFVGPKGFKISDTTNGVCSLCSRLALLPFGGTQGDTSGYVVDSGGQLLVKIVGVESLDALGKWFAANPTQFVLGRATPVEIQLDPINIPELPANEANVWFSSYIPAITDVTYWTTIGKNVSDKFEDIENDVNDANSKVETIAPDVAFAKSQIEILNKSIASLVVDKNGGSLMTQTKDGWQFNIGAIQSGLNGAIGDIQNIKGDISGVTDLADKTNQLANDLAKKTAYINMTQDESGQPVMELGQQGGEFKLRITNTSMDFMQGSQRIAYLSNRQLYIQSSVVTDEMKIGATAGYIWKKRANGNMGLRYVSK